MAKHIGPLQNRTLITAKLAATITNPYVICKIDTSEADELQVAVCGDTDEPFGIIEEAAAAGAYVRVCIAGVTLVRANAAFAIGDKLDSAAADGEADTIAAAGTFLGYALGTATAAGDLVDINIVHGYYGG